jgi:hypothetical protein
MKAKSGAARSARMVISRRRFEMISAVEGLFLPPDLRAAFEMFEAEGWPPEKQRAFIRERFARRSA